MIQYHKVYIPFARAMARAGPVMFTEFEPDDDDQTNLMVIGEGLTKRLGRMRDSGSGEQSKEILMALQDIVSKPGAHIETLDSIAIFKREEGLHIGIARDKGPDEFSMTELVEKTKKALGGECEPILLSDRPEHHIKYKSRGFKIEGLECIHVDANIVQQGLIDAPEEFFAILQENNRSITIDSLLSQINDRDLVKFVEDLKPNQFLKMTAEKGYIYAYVEPTIKWDKERLRVIDVPNLTLRLFKDHEYGMALKIGSVRQENTFGIRPLDIEQYIALQYGLYNPDITILFLCGGQGSGKTLLSHVATIDQLLYYDKDTRRRRYPHIGLKNAPFRRATILKPTNIMGGKERDPGILPGELFDKLREHLSNYAGAHDMTSLAQFMPFEQLFCSSRYDIRGFQKRDQSLLKKKFNDAYLSPTELFRLGYAGFMRGASISNEIVVIDEHRILHPMKYVQ